MIQLDLFGDGDQARPEAGGEPAAFDSIDAARAAASVCVRCDLSRTRRRVVFGLGRVGARLAVIGEGPSERDDQTGEPFSGPTGGLLDRWLARLGLDRTEVWVTNAVRCRAAAVEGGRLKNRPPRANELAACRFWLDTELALVRPELILGLGGTAGKVLVGKDFRITADRGAWREGPNGIPTLVTFNPAYILHLEGEAQAQAEALAHADLETLRRRLQP